MEDTAFASSEWKPALRTIADKIATESRRAMASGKGPDNYNWRPLNEDYAQRKGSRSMMVLSGKLRSQAGNADNAITLLTNRKLKYEVKAKYATTHQFGSSPNKGTGFPGARVRNYLIWGDELKKLVFDTLNDYGAHRRRQIMKRLR